jgi:hypothetical protein
MILLSASSCLDLFVMLALGHCVADFGLQSDRMAVEKCPGKGVAMPWTYWLAAHAGIHGFVVAWITGIPLLGLAEWAVHAGIDLGKCSGLYRLRLDQILHLLCKLVWAVLACRLLAPG